MEKEFEKAEEWKSMQINKSINQPKMAIGQSIENNVLTQ